MAGDGNERLRRFSFPTSGAEAFIFIGESEYPKVAYPTMRFNRVGDDVEIRVNGKLAVRLTRKEWNAVVDRMS